MPTRKKKKTKYRGYSTRAVHGGEDRKKFGDALITPISQTSTFVFQNTRDIREYTSKKKQRFEYARYGTPTQRVAERKLAALDEAPDCLLFSSGMSAVTTVFLALLEKGQHVVMTDDVYKKTYEFATTDFPRFGIECTLVPVGDYDAMRKAVKDNTVMIFSESPTNPYLYIVDLKELVKIAKRKGIITAIDSTFATPYNQKPLTFGVNLVIHSVTKYLGGHNDLLGGAVLGRAELIDKVRLMLKKLGGVMDPHCAYLLLRGLKTFAIRMERLNASGMKVARFLEKHPKIKRVYYPGLSSHPQHKVAKAQMDGFGSVVTFEIRGNLRAAERLLNNLQLCYIGPSLGGVETLITHPGLGTYYDMSREQRIAIAITDELFRLAVGVEDPEDIMADLDQALRKAVK